MYIPCEVEICDMEDPWESNMYRSDHISFRSRGVRSLQVNNIPPATAHCGTCQPAYHTPLDVASIVDEGIIRATAKTMAVFYSKTCRGSKYIMT
eukprot:UN00832